MFKISFSTGSEQPAAPMQSDGHSPGPVRSLVQVYFPARGMTLSYYNDAFDLRKGDTVFVEGKLEGFPGRVTAVSYNFKIKLSDYKRVIGRADTDVHGTFRVAGSHLITFDPAALPYEKVRSWFLPPETEEDGYITGQGGGSIALDAVDGLDMSPAVWERGKAYYRENKVVFLSLDHGQGRAIVMGTKPYEVEFRYDNDDDEEEISELVCPCLCSYPCKHQAAVLLQLQDILECLEEDYGDEFYTGGYFAAVSRDIFFSYAVGDRRDMIITI